MNPDASEKARLEVVHPWAIKAAAKIISAVESASAHAEKALTRSAIESPDGRMTWRTLNGQRSHNAAQERLDELCETLVSTTAKGIRGLVQDARVDFYRRAFGHWAIMLPEAIRCPNAEPKFGGETAARGLIIFGLSPFQEFQPTVATAKRSLMVTLNAAASANKSRKESADLLDGWEKRSKDAIYKKIVGMLSDSEVAISTIVGSEMIKPSMRAKTSGATS